MITKFLNKKLFLTTLILLCLGSEAILAQNDFGTASSTIFQNQTTVSNSKLRTSKSPVENKIIETEKNLCSAHAKMTNFPSVMLKKTAAPGGDKHDYYSPSPFFWPDPSNNNTLSNFKDGFINPDFYTSDYSQFQLLLQIVTKCNNAYLFTSDQHYAGVAYNAIKTWFLLKETKMNPNLKYGQVQQGDTNKKYSFGMADLSSLWILLEAIIPLKTASKYTSADDQALFTWINDFHGSTSSLALSTLTQKSGLVDHNFIYLNLNIIAMTNFLKMPPTSTYPYFNSILGHMSVNIKDDGTMPIEANRANAFHYSVLALEGYLIAAEMARNLKYSQNFYTFPGGRIKKALDLMRVYANNKTMPGSNVDAIDPSAILNCLILYGTNYDAYYLTVASAIPGYLEKYAYYSMTGSIIPTIIY